MMKVAFFSGLLLHSALLAQIELCSVNGTNANDELGTSVAGVTTTAGASYALFGAINGTFGLANTGTVTVRNPQCAAPPPFFFPITGAAMGDQFGAVLADAGQHRFLVGSPRYDAPGLSDAGRAVMYDATTGAPVFTFDGRAALSLAGAALAIAGDVNGDGSEDVLVGATQGARFTCTFGAIRYLGSVYVVSGSSVIQRIDGMVLRNNTSGCDCENLGSAVGGFCDVDSDGLPEFLIGSRTRSRVYVHGWDSSTSQIIRKREDTGPSSFGYRVCALDDVDGDGVCDYAASAPTAREVRVISGKTGNVLRTWVGLATDFGQAIANVGDQDGRGLSDVLVGAPGARSGTGDAYLYSVETGNVLAVFRGSFAGGRFGASVAKIADWTGDGVPEVAIGAPKANGAAGLGVVMTLDSSISEAMDIGAGCAPAGTSGFVPRVGTPNGAPRPGFSEFSIAITETVAGSQAFLFLGLGQLSSPFCLSFIGLGSCCLHVDPTIVAGLAVATVSTTTANGAGQGVKVIPIPLPSTLPVGTPIFAQFYALDPGGIVVPATMTPAKRWIVQP